jgi:regulator of cell morphogenesis and NO signaling
MCGRVQTDVRHMEFARLREITDDYTVPGDVCETYEAVYGMLADLDKAYHA